MFLFWTKRAECSVAVSFLSMCLRQVGKGRITVGVVKRNGRGCLSTPTGCRGSSDHRSLSFGIQAALVRLLVLLPIPSVTRWVTFFARPFTPFLGRPGFSPFVAAAAVSSFSAAAPDVPSSALAGSLLLEGSSAWAGSSALADSSVFCFLLAGSAASSVVPFSAGAVVPSRSRFSPVLGSAALSFSEGSWTPVAAAAPVSFSAGLVSAPFESPLPSSFLSSSFSASFFFSSSSYPVSFLVSAAHGQLESRMR